VAKLEGEWPQIGARLLWDSLRRTLARFGHERRAESTRS
jgi:hypothetical protein